MNRIHNNFFILLVCLIFCLPVLVSASESIGVSPAQVLEKIYTGESREVELLLSRSHDIGDYEFDVYLEKNIDLVMLPSDKVVIPDGEKSVSYKILLNSEDFIAGNYANVLHFVLNPEGVEQVAVSLDLAVKMDIEIENTKKVQGGALRENNLYWFLGLACLLVIAFLIYKNSH